jgi:hypothetical protein
METISRMQATLTPIIGGDVVVYPMLGPVQEGTFEFECNNPTIDFKGFTVNPWLRVEHSLAEEIGLAIYRIERIPGMTIFTDTQWNYHRSLFVSGMALECEPDSAIELNFLKDAMAAVTGGFVSGVQSALYAARRVGIDVSDTVSQLRDLVTDFT